MSEQPYTEDTIQVSEEVLLDSSTVKEIEVPDLEKTTMQTKVVENNENSGDIIAIVKQPSTTENVSPTQVEEEDNLNDIPGIRVSMATIVELPPLEEQQRLSDENAPTVSEKVIDEIF